MADKLKESLEEHYASVTAMASSIYTLRIGSESGFQQDFEESANRSIQAAQAFHSALGSLVQAYKEITEAENADNG